MDIGQSIKTSLGEVIVLDVKEKYLILFSPNDKKFIKANKYDKDNNGNFFWGNGEYYNNLDTLIKAIEG